MLDKMRALGLPCLFLLCLCLTCKEVKAYGIILYIVYHLIYCHNILCIFLEVLVWFSVGCSCSYSVNEQSGSLQVCAELAFINGTATTTTNYTVDLSASGYAQSKHHVFFILF